MDLSSLILFLVAFAILIVLFYTFADSILTEKQIYQLKYVSYVLLVMATSVVVIPPFLFRPRHAANIALAASLLNPIFRLFGIRYRLENAQVLENDRPYVVVANHQSSIDFIGMMRLWPKYIRYCTILAKKELFWALPFGFTAWLAGVEYVDRKNRERSGKTMRELTKKVQDNSLRLWVFPEGTRSMNDELLPFKFGAFRVAIEAQVPIVPVVFSSYRSLYNAEKKSNEFYWRRGEVTIRCLEPIETKGMTIEADLERLTNLTRQRMIDAHQKISSPVKKSKNE